MNAWWWRRTDFTKASWDEESNSRPVSVTGLNRFLILSHGVYLNIGGVVVKVAGAFPGNNILDVVRFETAKYDDVTAKKGSVVPSGGVDVNSIMYSTKHAFMVDVANGRVVNMKGRSIPSSHVNFISEFPWRHFIPIWVVGDCRMPAQVAYRESIASVSKNRLLSHGWFTIEMQGGRKALSRNKIHKVSEADAISIRKLDHGCSWHGRDRW